MSKKDGKKNMKRSKTIAIGIVCLFLGSILSALATRTITDTSDTIYTKIICSNGNVYDVTEANLLTAISSLGTSGGTIQVGADITLTAPITTLRNYTTLDFQDHTVTLGNHGLINFTRGCKYNTVKNIIINIPNKAYNPDVIVMSLGAYADDTIGWARRNYFNTFENIRMYVSGAGAGAAGKCYNYTGIKLDVATSTGASSMWGNIFSNIIMSYPRRGIYILNRDNFNWVNGNTFKDFIIDEYYVAVAINSTGGGATGNNLFEAIRMQSQSKSIYAFYLNSGDSNKFRDCVVHDWYAATGIYQWYIGSGAIRTTIDTNWLLNKTYIYDLGGYTTIHSTDMKEFYNPGTYQYIIFNNKTETFLQNASTGEIIFKNRDPQNVFYYASNIVSRSDPTYKTNGAPNTAIFVRSGTYNINFYIAPSGQYDMTWIGENVHTTKLVANASLATGFFHCNGRNNVTFKNLWFEAAGQTAVGVYIAFDTSTQGITVDNCIFRNFTGGTTSTGVYSAALSSDTVKNIKIRNCEFVNNDYAIWLQGDADPSKVLFCDISHNYFYGANGRNIQLNFAENCTVSDNIMDDGTYGVSLVSCSNITVNNNLVGSTNGLEEYTSGKFNSFGLSNNVNACTTKYTIIGTGSYALRINATTAKIGVVTSSGTTWK